MKIILTLDQFPVFLPGAYGNKTQKTPGLDAWTLQSTTFDRAYSTRVDGLETLFQLWEACDFSRPEFKGRKVFVSDLPVEAPAFFDEGKTVDPETFFASPENVLTLKNADFVWIYFQTWDWRLLDAWVADVRIQNQLIALLGTSGELPEGDVRLYSAEVQLPWWVRFSDPKYAGTRSHALVTPDDFGTILMRGNPDETYREEIRIHAENERWAFVTDEWFLTGFDPDPEAEEQEEDEDPPELYFKPADWRDQNDVSIRCFDEIQKLKQRMDQSYN